MANWGPSPTDAAAQSKLLKKRRREEKSRRAMWKTRHSELSENQAASENRTAED
jgi:hypothetical protein